MHNEENCTFKISSWEEAPIQVFENGAKLSNAKVAQIYKGAITGEGTVDYQMAYTVNGTAKFVGFETIQGVVSEKTGTFVVQHIGAFEEGKAKSRWSIVEGAGTGELSDLCGSGTYEAGHGEDAHVSFNYHFSSHANKTGV